MNLLEFSNKIDSLDNGSNAALITVHTGGMHWEEVVDVIYCQECKQFHIISERVKGGG